MKHQLNFTIANQVSCDSILLFDTSVYLAITPTDPILYITPPNSVTEVSMAFNISQATNITCDHVVLTSGVYKLRLSVCPNATLFVEKSYLRICDELEKIRSLVCEGKDVVEVKMMLEVAQDLVWSGEVAKGIEIYNLTVKKIKALEGCITC